MRPEWRGPGASSQLIASLRSELLEVLTEVVGFRQRVALIGFPTHPNVGDSAIWLGELAALRSLGATVVSTSSITSYDPRVVRERLGGQGKVLLHGGGNLGDEWPQHQLFREQVIADLRDLPIIQLPQSVHFNSTRNLHQARAVFDAHSELTLLCRDARSLEVAHREFLATSWLCPDAALGIRGLGDWRDTGQGVLWLARTDSERRREFLHGDRPGHRTADWLSPGPGTPGWESSYFRKLAAEAALGREQRRRPALAPLAGPVLSWAHRSAAAQRVTFGVRLLSTARVIVTDRLHAHILSLLLGVPHVVLDTGYGKIEPFVREWTQGAPGVHFVQGVEDAANLAQDLEAMTRGREVAR